MRWITLGLVTALALGAVSGCIFSPDRGKGGGGGVPPPEYATPEYPQIVLSNLIQAYGARDSVEYRKLFALNYQGGSYDTSSAAGLQPGNFTWIDEVHHIQALAEDNSILEVKLNLGSSSTWRRIDATGPSGEYWAEITIFNPTLEINFGTDSDVLIPNEFFTFRFAPVTPAPAATNSDTLWYLVRWEEISP